MNAYVKEVQIRWADLDSNAHLRHSVYYDWGSFCRVSFLNENGLTVSAMHQQNIGPILFREECIFKREVRLEDTVTINIELIKARKDFSRWSIRHTIFKADIIAAIVTVDGAWMDTIKRKLCTPPQIVIDSYEHMPKSEDFEWMPG